MNNQLLSVRVAALSTITLSLHEAAGARIVYRVPSVLMSLKTTEYYEQQTEDLYNAGKLSKADYETSKEIDQRFRRLHEDFIRWHRKMPISTSPDKQTGRGSPLAGREYEWLPTPPP
jgi:hypothetical protein